MKLNEFEALSFDCYGTLIDWETGLLEALEPLVRLLPERPPKTQILEDYAREESAQQAATPALLYSDLLQQVHGRLASLWRVEARPGMAADFGASVATWPAFEDSQAALTYLGQHFELIILSNVDRQSFAGSQARLGVTFGAVYTAEEIGSYKPDPRNFEYLIDRLPALGIAKHKLLHVAQSQFHDHVPARQLGLANAWIDRRHDQPGWGATAPPPSQPAFDFRFNSLAELATAHQQASRE